MRSQNDVPPGEIGGTGGHGGDSIASAAVASVSSGVAVSSSTGTGVNCTPRGGIPHGELGPSYHLVGGVLQIEQYSVCCMFDRAERDMSETIPGWDGPLL